MIRILVDSSSDYRQKEAEEKGMLFVPIRVMLSGEQYRDGIDIEKDRFYELLQESGEFPLTSQPSPQEFLDIFREMKERGDEVICILLSSRLSGTYQSALLGKQMSEHEGVYLVDSCAVACPIRILTEYALSLVKEGLSAEEIVSRLEEAKSRTRVIAMIDTLEYLRRGGRIGGAAAALGNIAQLKPILTLNQEGEIQVLGKALGKNKAIGMILKELEAAPVDEKFPVYSLYTYGTENCGHFEERLKKENIPVQERLQVGLGIGAHIGTGAFGIAYVAEK